MTDLSQQRTANISPAIPKKRGSGQSASSTASAANVPSSTPETNVDKVAWILYSTSAP